VFSHAAVVCMVGVDDSSVSECVVGVDDSSVSECMVGVDDSSVSVCRCVLVKECG